MRVMAAIILHTIVEGPGAVLFDCCVNFATVVATLRFLGMDCTVT